LISGCGLAGIVIAPSAYEPHGTRGNVGIELYVAGIVILAEEKGGRHGKPSLALRLLWLDGGPSA
jgi:hypothetical protein